MPNPGFYLVWTQGSGELVGQINLVFQEQPAVQGITFPGASTTPVNVQLASCAREIQSFDTLRNVRLYLTGDPDEIQTVQTVWPSQGGGFFISYDGGRTYQPFTTTYGYEADPSTWPLLPQAAIGLSGTTGQLGPLDSANLVLKYIIPVQATQYQVYSVSLTADFDVA